MNTISQFPINAPVRPVRKVASKIKMLRDRFTVALTLIILAALVVFTFLLAALAGFDYWPIKP